MSVLTVDSKKHFYKLALALAAFTIAYNVIEGLVCTLLGFSDESITLFGFGTDSFIETISGLGIFHMVSRIQAEPKSNRDNYERSALRITGFAFYILVFGLVLMSVYNIITGQQPETTFYGVIISVISILVMLILLYYKTKTGKALESEAILADAECTRVCIYMSVVLLASSAMYYFFHFRYTDSIGALLLAYFSFSEGKECFEKSRSDKYCSCDHP